MTETNFPNVPVADFDPSRADPAGDVVTPGQVSRPDVVVVENGIPVHATSGKPLDPEETAVWHLGQETLRTNLEAVGPGNQMSNPIV